MHAQETREDVDVSSQTVIPPEKALETVPGRIQGGWLGAMLLLLAIGVGGFVVAAGQDPTRAWSTVWANFLFWTALAQAGVLFGAVMQTAKGHWGKGFRRLGEGMGAFLPASFLIFTALVLFGAPHVFPWAGGLEGVEVRGHFNAEYLTLGGVTWRNTAGLLVLYGLSFWYLKVALRPDAPLLLEKLDGWRAGMMGWLARGWKGEEAEMERVRTVLGRLAPALILAWVVVFSFLSFDMIMAVVPGFFSMIWGPYYFVGGWLCMLALMALLAWRYNDRYDLSDHWGRWEFHDLGKLLFAFVIFWSYLWWSQYLVIWYGNLGWETVFFEQRTAPGFDLYWLQMILIFGLPFVLLLWRKPKMRPGWLAFVAVIILAGFWLERHLLVAPSVLEEGGSFVPGWPEAAVSLGFVGLFGLCYSLFASTFPKVPIRETFVGEASTGP
jgi:hypothetical protein